jgi:hypothetical protein
MPEIQRANLPPALLAHLLDRVAERNITKDEPSTDVALLLEHLHLTLPPQPPPKIRYPAGKQPL